MRVASKAILLLVLPWVMSLPALAGPPTAKDVIENFYKSYLGSSLNKNDVAKKRTAKLAFSKSFQVLVDKNAKVCHEKAGTDVCGWGADIDVYLNSQETDPKLNYKNSGFSVKESKPGSVTATFNVYPSIKNDKKDYQREILFLMVQENGQWVVDDMIYDNKSSRKMLQDENNLYDVNPTTKSLCQAPETVLFSCQHKEKIFSLCGSPELASKTGYIQYRVGKKDPSKMTLELEFPKTKILPQKIFKFELLTTAGSITFKNAGYEYRLISDAKGFNVVSVEKDDQEISHFECPDTDTDANLAMTSIQKLLHSAGLGN